MSSGRIVRLVAGREIRVRLASKALRITTAILLVPLVAMVVVIDLTSAGSSAQKVGLTPPVAGLSAPLQAAARAGGEQVRTPRVERDDAGAREVRSSDLDALVTGTPQRIRVLVKDELDDDLRVLLQSLARQEALDRRITALGGDPQQVTREVAATRLDVSSLEPQEPYHDERLAIGMIVGVLVYLALLTYGQTVAQGVVEEKTSRVVELLLSTIRAWQLWPARCSASASSGCCSSRSCSAPGRSPARPPAC